MSYYIKDSFVMPCNEGIKATVVHVDHVVLEPNIFKGTDAKIFTGDSEEPSEVFPGIRCAVEDPALRERLHLGKASPLYVTPEDVVLLCKMTGNLIEWHKVTYEYTNHINE